MAADFARCEFKGSFAQVDLRRHARGRLVYETFQKASREIVDRAKLRGGHVGMRCHIAEVRNGAQPIYLLRASECQETGVDVALATLKRMLPADYRIGGPL